MIYQMEISTSSFSFTKLIEDWAWFVYVYPLTLTHGSTDYVELVRNIQCRVIPGNHYALSVLCETQPFVRQLLLKELYSCNQRGIDSCINISAGRCHGHSLGEWRSGTTWTWRSLKCTITLIANIIHSASVLSGVTTTSKGGSWPLSDSVWLHGVLLTGVAHFLLLWKWM